MAKVTDIQHKIKDLPEACITQINQATLKDDKFFDAVEKLERDFCYHFNSDIFPQSAIDRIQNSKSDPEAARIIIQTLTRNGNPQIIKHFLARLWEKGGHGYKWHTEVMTGVYLTKIGEHHCDGLCRKDFVTLNIDDQGQDEVQSKEYIKQQVMKVLQTIFPCLTKPNNNNDESGDSENQETDNGDDQANAKNKICGDSYKRTKMNKDIPWLTYIWSMCFLGEDILVGTNKGDIFKYSKNLKRKDVKYGQLQRVTGLTARGSDIIACDGVKGIHELRNDGSYKRRVGSGCFSDACLVGKKLFALEYKEEMCYVYEKRNNRFQYSSKCGLENYHGGGTFRDKICVQDGTLYISSYQHHKVHLYSLQFEFQKTIGEKGTGWGEVSANSMYHPRHIQVDGSGNVIVCDYGNKRILKYDKTTLVAQILIGKLEGYPAALVLSDNDMWIALEHYFLYFLPTGQSIRKYEAN